MWSPSLVPKPKDWPEWVDIVGTFDDRINNVVKSSTGTEAAQNLKSVEKYRKQAEENSSDDIMDSNLKTTAESPTLSNDFIPTEELVSFLGAQGPVVFVGFGSMVIKDLEQKIAMFLEAAAVAGIRLIVQVGWSELSPIRFKQLALEAQQKANIIREMEHMNNSLEDLIFPGNECSRSPKATTKPLFNSWFGSALSLTGFSPKDSKNADPKAINVAASNAKHQEIIRSDANTYKEDLSTWDVSEFDNCWRAASDALLVGPLPHSWLFERVTAVVHHGGAGKLKLIFDNNDCDCFA